MVIIFYLMTNVLFCSLKKINEDRQYQKVPLFYGISEKSILKYFTYSFVYPDNGYIYKYISGGEIDKMFK